MKRLIKEKTGLLFWTAVVLFILPVSLAKIYDIDIWWHMQCGKSMLESFSSPDFSKFYFTPVIQNASSLRYTWLGDILFHLVHLVSGDAGLQMMRLLIVLGACVLVRAAAGKDYKAWHLLVLMALIVGTYQKQIVRNSLFALLFTPLIFWMWHEINYRKKEYLLWFYPVILGLWSCLHGSYLLGYALVLLILTGDTFDMVIRIAEFSKKKMVKYLIVLILSFGLISFWNPTTLSFLNISNLMHAFDAPQGETIGGQPDQQDKPRTGSIQKKSEIDIQYDDFVPVKQKGTTGLLEKIKTRLNNTVFKTSGPLMSVEFLSPFDKFDRLYVKVALLFGLVGILFIVLLARPLRLSIVFPFAAVVIVGCGYLRLTGYIPIVTAFVIFCAAGNNEVKKVSNPLLSEKNIWGVGILFLAAVWINCMAGYPVYIGTEQHEFGLGRTPTYSTKVPDRILKEFQDKKVFTTLANGGYLLYRWYPDKKVFVDGFFAPHGQDIMVDYRIMLEKDINPDYLHTKHGIDIAVVEHTTGSILNNFCLSENWYAAFMDEGMICFVYEPDFNGKISVPQVLFNENDFSYLPFSFKEHLAQTLHTVLNSLYKKGRIKDGNQLIKQYQELFTLAEPFVDKNFLDVTQTLKTSGLKIYGDNNSKAMYWEFKHNAALEMKDDKKIIEYGLKVLEQAPHRLPVILNVAVSYANLNDAKNCLNILDILHGQINDKNRNFLEVYKRHLSSLYWRLHELVLEDKGYVKAYDLARTANKFDKSVIPDIKLYEAFAKIVIHLNKEGELKSSLNLLERMKEKFESYPRWLNDMAWQLLITEPSTDKAVLRAEKYALEAVRLMERDKFVEVDFAYDTLAEVYYKMGKKELGCDYMKKALLKAPINRKIIYQDKQCE